MRVKINNTHSCTEIMGATPVNLMGYVLSDFSERNQVYLTRVQPSNNLVGPTSSETGSRGTSPPINAFVNNSPGK